jgi:hypothetical protein
MLRRSAPFCSRWACLLRRPIAPTGPPGARRARSRTGRLRLIFYSVSRSILTRGHVPLPDRFHPCASSRFYACRPTSTHGQVSARTSCLTADSIALCQAGTGAGEFGRPSLVLSALTPGGEGRREGREGSQTSENGPYVAYDPQGCPLRARTSRTLAATPAGVNGFWMNAVPPSSTSRRTIAVSV